MARPDPRMFEVIRSIRLTANMHRITLGGDGLVDYPEGQAGGYIKLMLSNLNSEKPILRTYTIRNQTEEGLDVDFALHGSNEGSGPATKWALNAQMGEMIKVGGPGPAKPLPEGRGPFLLIGDMTSLPAISVNLEALPDYAKGQVIILVRNHADRQNLITPTGIKVDWLVEENLGANSALLAEAARKLPFIDEYTYAWVACEFEAMKLLRQYLREEQKFGKERLYISRFRTY